jgi:hypothetical protein
MSVSLSGTAPLSSSPITAGTQHKGAGKAQGAEQDQSSQQITNQVSTTNADGSTTTTITYADGTTSTTTQQGSPAVQAAKAGQLATAGQPSGAPGTSGGLLDPTNLGQNAALLSAQEKARG